MILKTSHITIDGKPLCYNHMFLTGDPVGRHGNRVTCDFNDGRVAKEVHKHLVKRLVNANVRLKGGRCPDSRKGA